MPGPTILEKVYALATDAWASVAIGFVDGSGLWTPVGASAPLPVALAAPVGGGITWGAPTAVVSDGTSKTLIAANAARKALQIWNPTGNAQMSLNLAGGTVTLAAGLPLLAGDKAAYTGAECSVGAVTFIGTNTQSLVYQEGT